MKFTRIIFLTCMIVNISLPTFTIKVVSKVKTITDSSAGTELKFSSNDSDRFESSILMEDVVIKAPTKIKANFEYEQEGDDRMFDFTNDSGNGNSNNLRFKQNKTKNANMIDKSNNIFQGKSEAASSNQTTQPIRKINIDDYEVPELRKANDPFKFDTNSIESFKIDINQFNNINDNNLSNNLDFDKLSTIKSNLLNTLKDQIKLNLLTDDEQKKLRVARKQVPIIIKNNDDPYVYSKMYN